MSSISSSASSRSMILMATTCWVLLSMPLKTSPKLPFPIRSCFVNISSGSTFCNRNSTVSGYYFLSLDYVSLRSFAISRVISVKKYLSWRNNHDNITGIEKFRDSSGNRHARLSSLQRGLRRLINAAIPQAAMQFSLAPFYEMTHDIITCVASKKKMQIDFTCFA